MTTESGSSDTKEELEKRFREFQSKAAADYEEFVGKTYPLRSPKPLPSQLVDHLFLFISHTSKKK